MLISTCVVSRQGFENPAGNQLRLELLEETMQHVANARVAGPREREQDAKLLCFPGGYLYADGLPDRQQLMDQVRSISKMHTVPVLLGIDEFEKKIPHRASPDYETWLIRAIELGELPWFLYAYDPVSGFEETWNQRSTRRENAGLVSPARCQRVQTIPVGRGVEGLLCGELFNEPIRQAVGSRRMDLAAVVNIVHDAYQYRGPHTMQIFSSNYCLPVYYSAHASSRKAAKHGFVVRRGIGGHQVTSARSTLISSRQAPGKPSLVLREWQVP